mmetsp:Transcript_5729/g.10296  ORF Transcript_5729/g.10296 Transcript_5729/m.10296 type:complete len:207 (+) Transcript_5729:1201-1821(+)
MLGTSAFFRGTAIDRLSFFAFSSTMLAPCIMLKMPMSSSRMSSVFSGTCLAVCRSAMIASFCTTFSSSFISFELSISAASSISLSSSFTSALNLKTVEAICRTVSSIRSRGRTASSVTTLDKARPQKTMMIMMKHMVAMLKAASTISVCCMLNCTMKVSVCTIHDDDNRLGPVRPASHPVIAAADVPSTGSTQANVFPLFAPMQEA